MADGDVNATSISGLLQGLAIDDTTPGLEQAFDFGYFFVAIVGDVLDGVMAAGKFTHTRGPGRVGDLDTANGLILCYDVTDVNTCVNI